ncbi:MAG: ADP-ribosylation factor-like protein [Promethearchaeota archaeon]
MQSKKKIIFAGLDNSGKTSIILSLQQKFSYLNTKPTLGLSRSIFSTLDCLGFGVVLWDLGAQRKFRKNYFKHRYQVFSNTSSVFYVIDIQDSRRFDESIEYFLKIVETYKELDEETDFFICFHKMDPELADKSEFQDNIDDLMDVLLSIVSQSRISFFNTTIYDLSSLFLAFSNGIMHFSPVAYLINEQLEEYAKLSNSSAVLLMSEDLLVVGNYSTNESYIELCELVGLRFLNVMDSYKLNPIQIDKITVDLDYKSELIPLKQKKSSKESGKKAKIIMTSFETSNKIQFFIITLIKNVLFSRSLEELLPTLKNHLSDMMYLVTKEI